ncbi:M20/M25/M40 family metallo-hydrolase [candidate division WOR-3 bacterium]|uniref:M20/M25/M40 family metallo-hydrolase n=1 Tax=candidate division WOR-3 bacterium TaxID=2052148 RepID=A0A937XG94_UNCW3|nr:M20/M25/M40 family metallo-hydrolase [candidate division WOR-3 bacterium]
MLRKSFLLIVTVAASLAGAAEFLGLVPNSTPEDLAGRYTIVGVTSHGVLILSGEAADGDFAALHGRLLAENPKAHRYHTVRLLADSSRADLAAVSRILDFDGEQYLVEVDPDAIESFLAVPAMRGRISLDGWVMGTPAPELPRVLSNPTIERIVARVSPDSVLAFVQRLQDFGNRYALGESGKAAARWIAGRFRDWGCDTVILQDHDADYAPNVVGVRYGSDGRRQTYAVIDGHFDGIPWSPGADDNASGAVSAIEACRVTQGFQFRRDLRFIAFSAEELGLGSPYYAGQARNRGDSILGVLNFDMIGYADSVPEDLEVIGKIANPACEPLCDLFMAAADTYTTLNCNKRMMTDMPYSDHASFWNNGYVALCGSEDFWPPNPYYHSPGDSIGAGYNDNGFCTEVIRAGVAALATLGEPLPAGVSSSAPFDLLSGSTYGLVLQPNPVRGTAQVRFSLRQASSVKLEAYDRSGRGLATLASGSASAGAHSATWDTRDVPTGIYFLRLTAAGGQRSLKVVVGR